MAEAQITSQEVNLSGKVVKIVHFKGQLDETNVDNEAQKIYQLIDSVPQPHLILDFAELSYMNSKSIGYVTDWYSRVSQKSGSLSIAQAQPNILDILKVVGIAQIVNLYPTIEEAQQAMGGSAPAAPAAAPATQPATTPAAPAPTQPTAPTPAAPATTPAPTPIPTAPANPAPTNPNPTPAAPTPPQTPPAAANPIINVTPGAETPPATPNNPVQGQ